MKIEIIPVENGYILTQTREGVVSSMVFEDEGSEISSARSLLQHMLYVLGKDGSRHDEERLYVIAAPGDKHVAFTREHSDVIYGR